MGRNHRPARQVEAVRSVYLDASDGHAWYLADRDDHALANARVVLAGLRC